LLLHRCGCASTRVRRTCRPSAPRSVSALGSGTSGWLAPKGHADRRLLEPGAPLWAALPDIPGAVILSYEVGLIKPDPVIFRLVCDRLALQPAEIPFVGDTPSADVEGLGAIEMPAMLISDLERGYGLVRLTCRSRRFSDRVGDIVHLLFRYHFPPERI
jgi:hypothetical protein